MSPDSATLNSPVKEVSAKNYSHLLGMEGFSEGLLTTHFKLYEAYVKNTNTLLKKWAEFRAKGDYTDLAFGELKRHFGWEYNSVQLHELYFGALGKEKSSETAAPTFNEVVTEQFGSFEKWKEEFLGVGSARGIGWAVLYQDRSTGRLVNCWIDEHNNGHLVGSEPILVLDVFEHAYIADYGVDRKKYLTAFMKNVQWDKVENRLNEGK
jgi:Fe-Mn family superoxide dismutase